MKYHGGWSFIECYNLPVGLRTWFVKRLIKQLKDEKEQMEQASTNHNLSHDAVPRFKTHAQNQRYVRVADTREKI